MVSKSLDVRCSRCNALLAKEAQDGLCVRRGELQLTVSGPQFSVSVTCYRCSAVNVVTHHDA